MTAISSFSSTEFKELKIWVDDQKREYYRAIDVCYALKHSNPSQALSRLVDDDFIFQIDDGSNRAGKVNYLSEPGLYQLIFASKTEQAKNFQRWVFTKVLPKLRSQGIYAVQNRDESLADYEIREAALVRENNRLTQQNTMLTMDHCRHSLVERFTAANFKSTNETRGKYVDFSKVWERYQWWILQSQARPYITATPPIDQNILMLEMDRYFKSLGSPKGLRLHFDKNNGYGDVENAVLTSPNDALRNPTMTTTYQIGE
jgi:prophage antirepressor-like protein